MIEQIAALAATKASPWGAIIGGLGAIFAGNQQVKAAKEAAAQIEAASMRKATQMREMAGPFLDQIKTAMPALSSVVFREYGSKLGKDDPYLRAAHESNMSNIERSTAGEIGKSRVFWQGKGGNARDEELRIRRSGVESKNAENIGYGTGQRSYRSEMTDKFAGGLNNLLDYGRTGISLAAGASDAEYQGRVGAAETILGAKRDYYGDIGQLGGSLVGEYLGGQDLAKTDRLYGGSGRRGIR